MNHDESAHALSSDGSSAAAGGERVPERLAAVLAGDVRSTREFDAQAAVAAPTATAAVAALIPMMLAMLPVLAMLVVRATRHASTLARVTSRVDFFARAAPSMASDPT